MLSEQLETSVAQWLVDQGGPPEIALQLIAIAEKYGMLPVLPQWILFHIGTEWSAQQFDTWCQKLKDAHEQMTKGKHA